MSGAKLNADGRLGMMLTELRLPTIKGLATELCDQSDREGWPARQLLERLLEQEMNERLLSRAVAYNLRRLVTLEEILNQTIDLARGIYFEPMPDEWVSPENTSLLTAPDLLRAA